MKNMKQKEGMVTQTIGDGEIMVVPTLGNTVNKILTLNGSGGFVWKLLEEEKTFDELKESLINEYGISESEAKTDLTEFLNTIEDYIDLNDFRLNEREE